MILVALGANLPSRFGKPEDTLTFAKHELQGRGVRIVSASRIWLTAPVPAGQPAYRNAVIQVKTPLAAKELFDVLKSIEQDFGRANTTRNAPRIIDLDLLAYNEESLTTEVLTVPHPRMHERTFVLYPLHDIAPDWEHPVLKKSVRVLLKSLPVDESAKPIESEAA